MCEMRALRRPDIDDFSFDKLMFASLDDGKGIGTTVSAAAFDIVVVILQPE
jgi:hypothetical protein